MTFRYKECLEKGLLRRIPASKDKATRSMKKAEQWLTEAKKTLKGKAFDSAVLTSYMVMFHSARAILFHDGYRERSHACIARYLEEMYHKKGKLEKKWVELLDHHREVRHINQYDLSFVCTDEEARNSLNSSSQFLNRMKELLKTLIKGNGRVEI